MKLKCRIFGHKLGWEIFENRPCQRVGCDHVEPARKRPTIPPMPKVNTAHQNTIQYETEKEKHLLLYGECFELKKANGEKEIIHPSRINKITRDQWRKDEN